MASTAASAASEEAVKAAKVLMVGAGGIGCELLKTLALSGLSDIHIARIASATDWPYGEGRVLASATSKAVQQSGQYDEEVAVQLAVSHACIPLILVCQDPIGGGEKTLSMRLERMKLDGLTKRRRVLIHCPCAWQMMQHLSVLHFVSVFPYSYKTLPRFL